MRYIDGIGFYESGARRDVFLNNIYDADDNIIIEGKNKQISNYVNVNEVTVQTTSDIIYTIEGLRVNRSVQDLTPGLYIINGKKVAVWN